MKYSERPKNGNTKLLRFAIDKQLFSHQLSKIAFKNFEELSRKYFTKSSMELDNRIRRMTKWFAHRFVVRAVSFGTTSHLVSVRTV